MFCYTHIDRLACGKLQGDLALTHRGIVCLISMVILHLHKKIMLCEVSCNLAQPKKESTIDQFTVLGTMSSRRNVLIHLGRRAPSQF